MDTRDLLNDINALIDETMFEIDQLKKSKFAAAEIQIEGPGSDLAGKPTDGSLEAKKEDEEDEDDEEDEGDEDAKKADAEKTGEPSLKPTAKADDEHKVHADISAAESNLDSKSSVGELDAKDIDTLKGKGLGEAKKPVKKEDEEDEDDEDEKKEREEIKKSIQAQENLMKSYVDQRIGEVETKINNIAAMLEKIANQPVERKGVPAGVVPLRKSEEGVETLSKSEVADKLLNLKKSGASVSTDDIVRVETGSANDRLAIIKKYSLK